MRGCNGEVVRSNSNQHIQIEHASTCGSKPFKVIALSERAHKMHTNNRRSEGLAAHVTIFSAGAQYLAKLSGNREINPPFFLYRFRSVRRC